jgi:hypothetical protein
MEEAKPAMADVQYEGWLLKRGVVNTSWKRRYMRLRGHELSYSKDPILPAKV